MNFINCIVWDVDPVFFKIGSFSIPWYGFLFYLGIIIGNLFLEWQFKRSNHPANTSIKLFFYLCFGLLIGAFVGHRVFYEWNDFITDPLRVFSISGNIRGLSSHGATIGIIASLYIFHLRSGIRLTELGDRTMFSIATVASFIRLGNLMNSEIVGKKTDVAWSFCFPRYDYHSMIARHPSQIYEIIIGFAVLGTLLIVDKLTGGEKRPAGLLSGLFLTLYFSLRFIVEFFKEYQTLPNDFPLNMGQILSIPFFLYGVAITIWSLKKPFFWQEKPIIFNRWFFHK